jgi:hypothetical protein
MKNVSFSSARIGLHHRLDPFEEDISMFLVPSMIGVLVTGAAGPVDVHESAAPARLVVDVVVHGLEPMTDPNRARLRQDTSRIWDGAGVVLRWLEPDAPTRPHIVVRIDWVPVPGAVPCAGLKTLGEVSAVDGQVRGDTIRVSGLAAADIVNCSRGGPTGLPWPAAMRDRLVARVLARVIAHEIGHCLFGPSHDDRGLMRANLPAADLLAPLPARYQWPSRTTPRNRRVTAPVTTDDQSMASLRTAGS